jgi:hypothetical protein
MLGPRMMNPLSWTREHQLALALAALIGAALATVLGYLVYAVGWGEGALSFENWIWRLFLGPLWWALFGAVIGAAIIYVRNLTRAPVGSTALDAITRSSTLPQDRAQERPLHWLQERPPERSPRLPRSRL